MSVAFPQTTPRMRATVTRILTVAPFVTITRKGGSGWATVGIVRCQLETDLRIRPDNSDPRGATADAGTVALGYVAWNTNVASGDRLSCAGVTWVIGDDSAGNPAAVYRRLVLHRQTMITPLIQVVFAYLDGNGNDAYLAPQPAHLIYAGKGRQLATPSGRVAQADGTIIGEPGFAVAVGYRFAVGPITGWITAVFPGEDERTEADFSVDVGAF